MAFEIPEDQAASSLQPSQAVGLGEQQASLRGLARQTQGTSQAMPFMGEPPPMPPAMAMQGQTAPAPSPIPAIPTQEDKGLRLVDWANSLPVKEMQATDPEAFDSANKFFRSEGVVDEQGKTSPVRMSYLLNKAASDPVLFQKLVEPQMKVAQTKADKAFIIYDKARKQIEKEPDNIELQTKLKSAEKLYTTINDERNKMLNAVHEAGGKVINAKQKLDTKLKIGQFILENEATIKQLPPVEQNYIKTMFTTGDIDGFAKFMGGHATISDAHNARAGIPQ